MASEEQTSTTQSALLEFYRDPKKRAMLDKLDDHFEGFMNNPSITTITMKNIGYSQQPLVEYMGRHFKLKVTSADQTVTVSKTASSAIPSDTRFGKRGKELEQAALDARPAPTLMRRSDDPQDRGRSRRDGVQGEKKNVTEREQVYAEVRNRIFNGKPPITADDSLSPGSATTTTTSSSSSSSDRFSKTNAASPATAADSAAKMAGGEGVPGSSKGFAAGRGGASSEFQPYRDNTSENRTAAAAAIVDGVVSPSSSFSRMNIVSPDAAAASDDAMEQAAAAALRAVRKNKSEELKDPDYDRNYVKYAPRLTAPPPMMPYGMPGGPGAPFPMSYMPVPPDQQSPAWLNLQRQQQQQFQQQVQYPYGFMQYPQQPPMPMSMQMPMGPPPPQHPQPIETTRSNSSSQHHSQQPPHITPHQTQQQQTQSPSSHSLPLTQLSTPQQLSRIQSQGSPEAGPSPTSSNSTPTSSSSLNTGFAPQGPRPNIQKSRGPPIPTPAPTPAAAPAAPAAPAAAPSTATSRISNSNEPKPSQKKSAPPPPTTTAAENASSSSSSATLSSPSSSSSSSTSSSSSSSAAASPAVANVAMKQNSQNASASTNASVSANSAAITTTSNGSSSSSGAAVPTVESTGGAGIYQKTTSYDAEFPPLG